MAGRRIACAAPPSLREQKGGKRAEGEWEGSERERAVADTTGTPATKVRDSVGSLSSISSVIRAHTHTRRQRKKKKEILLDYTHTQNAIPSNSADSFFVVCLSSSLGQQQQNNNFLSPISWIQLFNCDKSRRSIVLRQSSCFVSDSKSFFFPTTKKDQNHTKTIDRIQQSVEFGEEC